MKVAQRQFISILILFVLVFSQFAAPQPAYAACSGIVRVDADSVAGSPDGCSWGNAFPNLQDALAIAVSGDQIWVAEGTYYPDQGGGNTPGDRFATFDITDGVALYGGFIGSENLLSQRDPDPATNNTTLSGDLGTAADINNPPTGYTDNSYHVVYITNITNATVVDGFTITKGYANGSGNETLGAGFYIIDVDDGLTLTNLLITDNRAPNNNGGGIFLKTILGSPVSTPQMSEIIFDLNIAARGGGLFTENSDPVINNVIFSNNEATAGAGGGANIQTVGVSDPPANPQLTNVIFKDNHAVGGGGLFIGVGTGTLENVTFNGNIANRRGGGFLVELSTLTLTNVTFYGNTSNDNLADPKGGGGMMMLDSVVTLNNATFSGNDSQVTGGDAIRSASALITSALTIDNSIFWGDTDDEILDDGSGTVTVSDSVVQGGITGTNIITTDPLLAALADNGGFTQTMALGIGSSAINTGNNGTCALTDQRGVSRPFGSACDMGAYEYDVVTGGSFTDTTVANFNAGTVGSCIVDAGIGDGALKLNLPSTSCVFESRIFDAGDLVDWTTLASTTTTPAGTTVSFNARTGNSASPDITWTSWQGVSAGTFTNPGSRYIQYRATLSTTDTGQTPLVEDVTINYVSAANISALISPTGTLTSWDTSFSWTGVNGATWYLLEVYTSGGTQLLRKWYTSTQTNCPSGTACSLTPSPSDLSLDNGDYQWRVLDYGAYGYGIWPVFKSFTISASCYTLTTNVSPASSGSVSAPSQSCTGGYTAGSVIQLTAVPGTGYAFDNWSGDANGSTNPVSVTMDGNKTVTANMRGNTPISPTGTLNNWNYSFSWTGLSDATWYLIEAQTSGGTQVFRQWYTSTQTNCAGGTACSVTPTGLSLANGDYKWRVLDYGTYGYGINSAFKNFVLNGIACYTLTPTVSPGLSGSVTVPAQTCGGGYTAGSVVQITAVPATGFLFNNWSGDASGTTSVVSVTMNSNKNVTANFKATVVLGSPSGTLGSWNNTFSWTGLSNATWYLLEVYTPGGTQVFRKWYTSPQTGCSGGTACSISPPETAGLSGSYKWRMLDYGAYGYGTWTGYTNFSIP